MSPLFHFETSVTESTVGAKGTGTLRVCSAVDIKDMTTSVATKRHWWVRFSMNVGVDSVGTKHLSHG